MWFLKSSFVYLKKELTTFATWLSGLPCWLSGKHMPIMTPKPVVSYFDSTFLSWVVYCGYTRYRVGLLSVRLTQMWLRTVTVTVYEQRITHTQKNIFSFNLVKVHYPAILIPYFSNWVPELVSGVPVSPLWFIFTALFWDFLSAKAYHILIKIRLLMSFRLYWGQ